MAENSTKKQRGPGKPFKPGRSGNPKGKPKGTRSVALVALDAIGDENAKDILKAVIVKANAGDMRAAEIIMSRIWPARKGRPITIDMPEITDAASVVKALACITAAAASGKIVTEEAAALAGLVELQRKAIETQDLEARISALEGKQNEID